MCSAVSYEMGNKLPSANPKSKNNGSKLPTTGREDSVGRVHTMNKVRDAYILSHLMSYPILSYPTLSVLL